MISSDGHDQIQAVPAVGESPATGAAATPKHELPTRDKRKANEGLPRDRVLMAATGALVLALVLFVSWSLPHRAKSVGGTKTATAGAPGQPTTPDSAQRSFFPITDSGRSAAKDQHDRTVKEQDIERTATETPPSTPASGTGAKGTLGSIPPFNAQQGWQAPPFQPGASSNGTDDPELSKTERDALSKPSMVFVRTISGGPPASSHAIESNVDPGIGLPTGTRLQARLAFAANTAVKTRVIAVVEYNYERDGEILIPAGARVVGNIEQADRSGYLSIRFDSLEMPDGSRTPIEAVATDLHSQMIKGRVEGKNTGKSVLARSLSGIGQAGALLIGRGSLNQPLSEGDLMRERLGDNIGLASDQQVTKLALTEHVVVSLSAGTPIYIVIQESGRQRRSDAETLPRSAQAGNSPSTQELRELLQLQRELNQAATPASQSN